MLKFFRVSLRILQVILLVVFLGFTYTLVQGLRSDPITRYWAINDPFLIPTNTDYNLLSESKELQIKIKENSYQTAQLKPLRFQISLKSNENVLFFSLRVWLIGLIAVILLMIGTEQLRQMIKSAQTENPFNKLNVRRVYAIALLFIAFPTLLFGLRWIVSSLMDKHITLVGLEWSLSVKHDLMYYLMGVFLITLGKIMERGIEIQEENKLTV